MENIILTRILIIQFIFIILVYLSGKDKESKIVLKPSKMFKQCTEKWTYINGLPIGFEVIWNDEVKAYFNRLQKKVNKNENNRRTKKSNTRTK